MSNVWDTLIQIQDKLVNKFEETGVEVFEPGLERFNKNGWINRIWEGKVYRRAHIDVVDARDTKKLWMMHCCVFPHFHSDSPIYGIDVIAGERKITGFFHDFSATVNHDHELIDIFGDIVKDLEWNKPRELPEWAKQIFSDHMIAAGNISKEEELDQILDLGLNTIDDYLMHLSAYKGTCEERLGKAAQNRYAYYQKQNPHNSKTMGALGLPEEDIQLFIEKCLFPSIE